MLSPVLDRLTGQNPWLSGRTFDADPERIGELAAAFVRAGLVDEVVAYVAPVLLGAGASAVGDLGIATMSDALRLTTCDVTRLGPDVRFTLETPEAADALDAPEATEAPETPDTAETPDETEGSDAPLTKE